MVIRVRLLRREGSSTAVEIRHRPNASLAERGESAAHVDDRLTGAPGLHPFHGVECPCPGGTGFLDVALLSLEGSEVAERYGEGAGERAGLAGADAAAKLTEGGVDIAYVAQGAGGFVAEAGFAEEEDAPRLLVTDGGGGQVVFGAQQDGDGGLFAAGDGEAPGVDDAEQRAFAGAGLLVSLSFHGRGGEVGCGAEVVQVEGLVGHGAQDVRRPGAGLLLRRPGAGQG
ncbi:hypothetical protein [Streptomyces abikoensis]|uniref:Uncharacterized protein n=1 Tax=Streptomyces abikoensis TaxID=97398 RepID=A0ABW7TFI1_9ACTN